MEKSEIEKKERGAEVLTFVQSDNTVSTIHKFKIDYSKIESLEQVIDILKATGLTYHWFGDDCPEQFKDLYKRGLLVEIE
jgi:hypothetical protein